MYRSVSTVTQCPDRNGEVFLEAYTVCDIVSRQKRSSFLYNGIHKQHQNEAYILILE